MSAKNGVSEREIERGGSCVSLVKSDLFPIIFTMNKAEIRVSFLFSTFYHMENDLVVIFFLPNKRQGCRKMCIYD